MSRQRLLSDAQWEQIAPLMPCSDGVKSRPFRDHRQVVEGVIYRFRTGVAWRDLPASFGPWQTVWKRHHRFSFDGTYQRIFDELRRHWADDELDDGMARLLSIDSTVVRAHQHAAGAPAAED